MSVLILDLINFNIRRLIIAYIIHIYHEDTVSHCAAHNSHYYNTFVQNVFPPYPVVYNKNNIKYL